MPEVIFPGPEGRLEGRYHPQKEKDAPIAIILHPHPQFGGTMNNRVVYNLHYAFYNMGFTVLRFNFRGVGRSQGEYDQGIGELSDAASALDYLQALNPNSKHCWVAGFSFGAFIALAVAAQIKPAALITVAPPVRMFDFDKLEAVQCPWLLVQGDEDEIVDVRSVTSWVDSLEHPPRLEILHGSSHFFHGKLLDLRSLCDEFLTSL